MYSSSSRMRLWCDTGVPPSERGIGGIGAGDTSIDIIAAGAQPQCGVLLRRGLTFGGKATEPPAAEGGSVAERWGRRRGGRGRAEGA